MPEAKETTYRSKGIKYLVLLTLFSHAGLASYAQDSLYFSLDQCIQYGLVHEPGLNQSLLNQGVTKATNAISLAGWLPQVNAAGNLQHYIQQPTTFVSNGTGASPNRRQGWSIPSSLPFR